MRHRIAKGTGLGNPDKELMNNKWTDNEKLNSVIKEMLEEGTNLWFKEADGIDFNIEYADRQDWAEVTFGIEPAYRREHLKIYVINTNFITSRWEHGIAMGAYGSNIIKNTKAAYEYKYNSKFRRFADKWSAKLREVLNGAV